MKDKYDFSKAQRGKFYSPTAEFNLLDPVQLQGTHGKQLLQFAGSIPKDDLKLIDDAIKRGCEQVDLNEW